MKKTVAFTGPRPEKLPDSGAASTAILGELIERQIERLINRGYTRFFSGMSRGIDLIAADRVLRLKDKGHMIELWAALPCPEQAKSWRAADRKEHARILALCSGQVTVSDSLSQGCFGRRNAYMVDNAQLLFAVYDGKSGGGTEDTIERAVRKGLPIMLIDPVSLGVTELEKTPEQMALTDI